MIVLSRLWSATTATSPALDTQHIRPLSDAEARPSPSDGLGLLPVLSLTTGLAVFVISLADRVSRLGLFDGQLPFWLGVLLLVGPILARQLSSRTGRAERIGLVLLLAIGLYLVKVASSPQAFTYPDELAQLYNLDAIRQTGHLFQPNPLVDVTALYPGMPSVASAFATLTGLGDFETGIALMAVARLMMMLVLFLLLEQVTASSRLAGIGTTLYVGHPNFLFYSAEFSYEALAMPLAGLAVLAAARRMAGPSGNNARAWTVTAVVAIMAVTVTHHLTSYALVGALCFMAVIGLAQMATGRVRQLRAPWDLAVIGVITVGLWVTLVAGSTGSYLGVVLGPAAQQGLALLSGRIGRQPFQAQTGVDVITPLWQQLLGYAAIVVVAVGLVYGLLRIPRRLLKSPTGLLLLVAAAVYLPLQVLRLTPAGWETANRSSEFMFLGCALVLAIAMAELVRRSRTAPRAMVMLGTVLGLVIVLGGAMTGWPYSLQIPPPYAVTAENGALIEPEGVGLARSTREQLGPDLTLLTDPSNALMFAAYGREFPFSGPARGVQSVLLAPYVDASTFTILDAVGTRYVVFDRRTRSLDHGSGFYPPGGAGPLSAPSPLFSTAVVDKFEQLPGMDRIADSGNIVVYNLSGVDTSSLQ